MRNTVLILPLLFFFACNPSDESKKEYGELALEVQTEIDTTIDVGGEIPIAKDKILQPDLKESKKGKMALTFEVQIDTVMVDSRGEILMAGSTILLSDLSADDKYLYNFDRKTQNLEVIDLIELELERKIQFNSDGPNATSRMVQNFLTMEDGNIVLKGFEKSGKYNIDGELIESLPLNPLLYKGKGLEWGLGNELVILDGNYALTLPVSIGENIPQLIKLDLKNEDFTFIPFPPMKRYDKFLIKLEGERSSSYSGITWLGYKNSYVYIHSNLFNETVLLNPVTEEIKIIPYYSKLTANAKEGGQAEKVSSLEEFNHQIDFLEKQINFGKWAWDRSTERFYRLSYYYLPKTADKARKSNVYLTVFDKDFNMLGETYLEQYQKKPGKYFAKDGTVWIHENVEDELGFIRLKISQ